MPDNEWKMSTRRGLRLRCQGEVIRWSGETVLWYAGEASRKRFAAELLALEERHSLDQTMQRLDGKVCVLAGQLQAQVEGADVRDRELRADFEQSIAELLHAFCWGKPPSAWRTRCGFRFTFQDVSS